MSRTNRLSKSQICINDFRNSAFIKNWLVCGPFDDRFRNRLDHDFLKRSGGEAEVGNCSGFSRRWKLLRSETDIISLEHPLSASGNVIGYAFCYIKSDKKQTALLNTGSDDYLKVWLNGREVIRRTNHRFASTDRDIVQVKLKKGLNRLLVKAADGVCGFRFLCRLNKINPVGSSGIGVVSIEQAGYTQKSDSTWNPVVSVTLTNLCGKRVKNVIVRVLNEKFYIAGDAKGDVFPDEPLTRFYVPAVLVKPDVSLKREVEVSVTAGEYEFFAITSLTYNPASETGRIYVVPGFHADPVRLEDQRDYMVSLFSSMRQNLIISEFDGSYGFYLSEISYLKPFFDQFPQQRGLIIKLIRSGLAGTGGAYNQAAETLIGGEAFIKNLLYGRLFHERVLGDKPDVYMSWDVFGHIPQLPQILQKSRYNAAVWSKYIPGVPALGYHQGPDGTKLLYRRVEYGFYGTPVDSITDLQHYAAERFTEFKANGIKYDIRFDADDFKAPSPYYPGKSGKPAQYHPEVIVTGAGGSKYIKDLANQIDRDKLSLPVTTRDITYYHQGTGVSRTDLKIANRRAENELLNASYFATLACWYGAAFPECAIDKGWRQLLFGQHHDALTGTMCDRSFIDLLAGYREAYELAAGVVEKSLELLAGRIDTKEKSGAVPESRAAAVVFNPSSWKRKGICRIDLKNHFSAEKNILVTAPDGKNVPCERSGQTVRFIAEDIPSCGHRTYYLSTGEDGDKPETVFSEETVIENEFFRLTADPSRGGCLTSLYDKAHQRETLDTGSTFLGNELVFLKQDRFRAEPSWEFMTTGDMRLSQKFPASVQRKSTPLGSSLHVVYDFENCSVEQEIILWNGADYIDFETRILVYRGEDDLAGILFPAGLVGNVPVYEERFGAVVKKRSAGVLDFRTHQMHNYSNMGGATCVNWADVSYSGFVEAANGKRYPLGMTSFILPNDEKMLKAAELFQENLAKRGITATIWNDGNLDGENTPVPYRDSTCPYDPSRDKWGTSFRIIAGNPENNRTLKAFLGEHEYQFDENLMNVFLHYDPESQILTAAIVGYDDSAVYKTLKTCADDFGLHGFITVPKYAVIDVPDANCIEDYGFAVINSGTQFVSVEKDGTVFIALFHTAAWGNTHWGRDRLDFPFVPEQKSHSYRYRIYPHKGNWKDAKVYRRGIAFNNPFRCMLTGIHGGEIPGEFSYIDIGQEHVLLSMLKPVGNYIPAFINRDIQINDGVVLRVYEAEGKKTRAQIKLWDKTEESVKLNLLEEEMEIGRHSDDKITVPMNPFGIETYKWQFKKKVFEDRTLHLGPTEEPVQPVPVRFWDYNYGAAPMGYLPLNISISGNVKTGLHIKQGGVSINTIAVSMTNDFPESHFDVDVKLRAPENMKLIPDVLRFELEPLGTDSKKVALIFSSQKDHTGIISASFFFKDQIIEDFLVLGDLKIKMDTQLEGDTVKVDLDNRSNHTIPGALEIITPPEMWTMPESCAMSDVYAGPRIQKVKAPPKSHAEYSFEIGRTGRNFSGWAIVKLSCLGKVYYKKVDIPPLTR